MLNLSPRVMKQINSATDFDGVAQAGLSGVLVDQSGIPIYYAMHFNDDFVNFITSNGFTDPDKLKNIKPDTDKSFPTGVLEMKSSWRVRPDNVSEAEFRKNYLSTDAQIPGLKEVDQQGIKTIVADPASPQTKLVGLVGLHVVGVIEGHPEFVWASFEHRKNAPNGKRDADQKSLDPVDPVNTDWLLYKKGTSYRDSNPRPGSFSFALGSDGKVTPSTSVHRVFPSGEGKEDEDGQVKDLNGSVEGQLDPSSVLTNYKMIGAVWLEKGDADFAAGLDFRDDSLLQGEKQLSNMSMESFTQEKQVNCFSCHDTQAKPPMPQSRLNVSHSIIKFVQSP
jgi:hypothetical protein